MIHISECLPDVLTQLDQEPGFNPDLLESPIEEALARVLSAWIRHPDKWRNQVSIATKWGTFRPDFFLETRDGLRIALECDGRDFHSPFRDRCRDALILWSMEVDEILRFPGRDLTAAPFESFATAVLARPERFPTHMVVPIQGRYGPHLKIFGNDGETVLAEVDGGDIWAGHVRVTIRSRNEACGSSSWMKGFHEFAWKTPGRSLDDLIAKYMGERTASRSQ